MASERIWEYGILVQPMVLKEQVLGADVAQFTEELAAQLNQQVDQVSALVADPGRFGQTGPIEVLSHDIAVIGQTLVLSLLVRRPRG